MTPPVPWAEEHRIIMRLLEMRRSGELKDPIWADGGKYTIGERRYSLHMLKDLVNKNPISSGSVVESLGPPSVCARNGAGG